MQAVLDAVQAVLEILVAGSARDAFTSAMSASFLVGGANCRKEGGTR